RRVREREGGERSGVGDRHSAAERAAGETRKGLRSLVKAAEFENGSFRLAKELERTQRRLNALEYMIIPRYVSSIRYIQQTLEEREREEFVRLKHVKKVHERKEEARASAARRRR